MKRWNKLMLLLSISFFWLSANADGFLTNKSKLIVKPGTYLIQKGSAINSITGQIQAQGMITFEGALENQNGYEGIWISGNDQQMGSLIFQSGNPNASVQQVFAANGNHSVGAPLNGARANVLITPGNPESTLSEFRESDSKLVLIEDANMILSSGKGFMVDVSGDNPLIATFEGELQAQDWLWSSETVPALVRTSSGYNFLANPFSSAFDWDNSYIEVENMEESIWIWDDVSKSFLFRNRSGQGNLENGIVPLGQGFMVRALTSDARLALPASTRVHSGRNVYKSVNATLENQSNYLVLELGNGMAADELWLGFSATSTDDFDNGEDVSKLFSFEEVSQLYATHNQENFCFDMFGELRDAPKIIPVNLRVKTDGQHSLRLKNVEGFDFTDVQLEDTFTHQMMDVFTMETYTFNALSTDEESRFLLHFSPGEATALDEIESADALPQVYATNHWLYIRSFGIFEKEAKEVSVFDLSGRMVFNQSLAAGTTDKIFIETDSPMLIVRVAYSTQTITQKVLNK
ncbi:MAG: T9SS type A sorting domain-containing protein [Bacteroidales bacterium]|nr:T9SS type A sorting domain-containing protein [Bacteroidales bacterium]